MIPRAIESGDYDDVYSILSEDRAKLIWKAIDTHVIEARRALLAEIARVGA